MRADQVADVKSVIEPPHSKLVQDVVLLTLSAPNALSAAFASDQAAPARVKHGLTLAQAQPFVLFHILLAQNIFYLILSQLVTLLKQKVSLKGLLRSFVTLVTRFDERISTTEWQEHWICSCLANLILNVEISSQKLCRFFSWFNHCSRSWLMWDCCDTRAKSVVIDDMRAWFWTFEVFWLERVNAILFCLKIMRLKEDWRSRSGCSWDCKSVNLLACFCSCRQNRLWRSSLSFANSWSGRIDGDCRLNSYSCTFSFCSQWRSTFCLFFLHVFFELAFICYGQLALKPQ